MLTAGVEKLNVISKMKGKCVHVVMTGLFCVHSVTDVVTRRFITHNRSG